jgi:hypothetical protein
MENKSLPAITVCLLSAILSLSACGDHFSMNETKAGTISAKLDTAGVPKVVTESFNKTFPATTYVDWYSYPSFDKSADWYQYEPTYFSNKPSDNYFIAEFTHKDTVARAVYDKSGQKIALHQQFKGDLPKAIMDSIKNSDYQSWTIGPDKEQVFRDSEMDQMKIYRLVMEKGDKKHTIYFQPNGKMLKDVKVS